MEFLRNNWGALLLLGLLIFSGAIGYQLRNRYSIVAEFFQFLGQRKLWWMAPIIIVLLIISILIVISVNSPLFALYTIF